MTIKRSFKFAGAVMLVLSIWTGILAAMAFSAAPGTNLAIFTSPGQAAPTVIRAGGALEEFSSMIALTRSKQRDYVRRLYKMGALLVLDARVIAGCRAVLRRGQKILGQ